MILRLGATAAAFGAGGVVAGVTTVLAACTVARSLQVAARGGMLGAASAPRMPPSPYTPPQATGQTRNSGPHTSGAMSGDA